MALLKALSNSKKTNYISLSSKLLYNGKHSVPTDGKTLPIHCKQRSSAMHHITQTSLRSLLKTCVYLPLIIALTGIFSTNLSSTIQSQFIFGIPLILWVWLLFSVLICLLAVIFGSRLTFDDNDDFGNKTPIIHNKQKNQNFINQGENANVSK